MLSKIINQDNLLSLLLLYSVAALGGAYISEYGFGLEPCILCLYQRIPYFIVIVLGALGLTFARKFKKLLTIVSILTIFAGACIAFYHMGVEYKWFVMQTSCDNFDPAPTSFEELQRQVLGKTAVPCDKPQLVFIGLSMAGWNLVISLLVVMVSICIMRCDDGRK